MWILFLLVLGSLAMVAALTFIIEGMAKEELKRKLRQRPLPPPPEWKPGAPDTPLPRWVSWVSFIIGTGVLAFIGLQSKEPLSVGTAFVGLLVLLFSGARFLIARAEEVLTNIGLDDDLEKVELQSVSGESTSVSFPPL